MVVSVEIGSHEFQRRLSLNHAILRNAYLYLPIADDGHGEYLQVGRGQISSSTWCGRHTSFFVCRDKSVHQSVVLDGVDFSGKDAVSHGHRWCKKPECPTCFLNGWAGDNARAIWGKLKSGVDKGFGDVEHFSVSFGKENFGLPEAVLRKRAEDGCFRRGIWGAVLILHARRIDRKNKNLKFGIHYHGLGFVRGGFDICRNCEVFKSSRCGSGCGGCKGYEARTRREKVKDGLIVKIFAKRSSGFSMEESTVKTARYILSHASYIPSFRKRFYIVSYFGECANKRLKSCKISAIQNCPVCASVGVKNVMVKCSYWGDENIPRDIGNPLYRKCFPSDSFGGSGLPLFVDIGGGGFGKE
jgi:hypothetical protein